jgi:hypothetical protein
LIFNLFRNRNFFKKRNFRPICPVGDAFERRGQAAATASCASMAFAGILRLTAESGLGIARRAPNFAVRITPLLNISIAGSAQLRGSQSLRIRLTSSLARRFNPWGYGFD